MSITRVCHSCKFEYGKFRPRCPACGSPAPTCKHGLTAGCAVCAGTVRPIIQNFKKERTRKEKKVKEEKSPCVFCHQRAKAGTKKVERCPHCEELIHKRCRPYHDAACIEFQRERLRLINVAK